MGKFLIRQTDTGWKFDLKAANGETVATSEVYSARAACVTGAKSVMNHAPKAKYADLTQQEQAANPKFELFRDKAGCFRFRLTARNGKVIAVSEAYSTKAACEHGIASVRLNAENAPIE